MLRPHLPAAVLALLGVAGSALAAGVGCTATSNPPLETHGSGTPAPGGGGGGGGGGADAGGDGGCAPTLTGFAAATHPAVSTKGACTAAQVQGYYDACLGPNAATQACANWPTAWPSCNTCLFGASNVTGTGWGPILEYPLVIAVNQGGCVALDRPTATDCASALDAQLECAHAACDQVCNASLAVNQDCLTAALTSACASYTQAVTTACQPVQSVCTQQNSQEGLFLAIVGVFCE
jgi:hypothetical protein